MQAHLSLPHHACRFCPKAYRYVDRHERITHTEAFVKAGMTAYTDEQRALMSRVEPVVLRLFSEEYTPVRILIPVVDAARLGYPKRLIGLPVRQDASMPSGGFGIALAPIVISQAPR